MTLNVRLALSLHLIAGRGINVSVRCETCCLSNIIILDGQPGDRWDDITWTTHLTLSWYKNKHSERERQPHTWHVPGSWSPFPWPPGCKQISCFSFHRLLRIAFQSSLRSSFNLPLQGTGLSPSSGLYLVLQRSSGFSEKFSSPLKILDCGVHSES